MSTAGIWHWAGYFIAAVAVALAIWSLWLRDGRKRTSARCPKCWYDLQGVAPAQPGHGWTCPECGHRASAEKQLHRRRRHWRQTGLAASLLAVAYGVWTTPRIQRSGWVGAVPTTVLIWRVAEFEPPERFDRTTARMAAATSSAQELAKRIAAGEMWAWQYYRVVDAVDAVKSRRKWPVGSPYKVSTGLPTWLASAGVKFTAASTLPGSEKHFDHFMMTRPWSVGDIPAGADHVDLEITVSPALAAAGRAFSWRGVVRLPITWVREVGDAIVPVKGKEVDQAVATSLELGIRPEVNAATGTDHLIGGRLYRQRGSVDQNTSIAVRVELLRDDEVRMSWTLKFEDSPFGEPVDWIRFSAPVPGWGQLGSAEVEHWRVRLTGDADAALEDLVKSKYWAGQYELPLRAVLQGITAQ